MIVADTNTIAYLYLPTEQTNQVVSLLHKYPHWVAPLLWRSEFRKILAVYVRKNVIDLQTAISMQSQAEMQFTDNEYTVNSLGVLTLASKTGCSTCDCEFVSLAKSLNLKLVTGNKKLVKTFPDIAMAPADYVSTEP